MKASIEAIQRCGYSEAILQVAKKWKNQKMCNEMVGSAVEHSTLSLFKHDECCYQEGVIKKSGSMIVELSRDRVIEVNTASHTLLRVNGEEVNDIEHNQVLDLSDEGERWEGDVLNNKPYGWGVLYDKEGEKMYEGFRIGKVNVCYGTQYYSDIQKVEYEGEWYGGMRSGHGIQYNRNGEVMYDGYWMYDEHMQTTVLMKERKLFHNFITTLKIEGAWTKKECLSESLFSMLPDLEVLITGDLCFNNQIDLTIMGMNNLKRIVIGNKCFRVWYYYYGRPENCFRVVDCPQLRSIEIGNRSFLEYCTCEFRNLPSLAMMIFGYHCFQWASLELRGD